MKITNCTTKKEINDFLAFNIEHYKSSQLFVNPLLIALKKTFDIHKNPFWKQNYFAFFLLTNDNKSIGRIACIINKKESNKIANFGFLECIDDFNASKLLFESAENFAKNNNCTSISGPYNPSINYELGILTSGFDKKPFFMMSYNFAFYDDLIKYNNYKKEQDFDSYLLNTQTFNDSKKLNTICSKYYKCKNLEIRNVDLKNIDSELKILFEIYNNAFQNHFGFIPFEIEEFMFMGRDMAQIVNPKFLKIVFWKSQPAGFLLALPNINEVLEKIKNGKLFPFGIFKFLYFKNKVKSLRIINVAIHHKFVHLGLGAILYKSIYEEMKSKKIMNAQLSWIAESNNDMQKIVAELGAKKENIYRIYEKKLV